MTRGPYTRRRICEACKFPAEGDRLFPMRDAKGLLLLACADCAREIQDREQAQRLRDLDVDPEGDIQTEQEKTYAR